MAYRRKVTLSTHNTVEYFRLLEISGELVNGRITLGFKGYKSEKARREGATPDKDSAAGVPVQFSEEGLAKIKAICYEEARKSGHPFICGQEADEKKGIKEVKPMEDC